MTRRMIQIGTGGWGGVWCGEFVPPNVEDGTVEVVAAVDADEESLANAREHLDLPADRCYTDLEAALDTHAADVDFCTVVVPPSAHEGVVETVLEYDLHVLSEKPIADSLRASCRIAERVERAGVKMGVTMSHRFDRDKTTLRRAIRSGDYGPLDYLVFRFTQDYREFPEWGGERIYDMEHPLLVEGGVHQLDMLADLAGSNCETLYAQTWNPPWSDFEGVSQVLATLTFENGVRAQYESATTNAVGLNGWGEDYIRAECRDAMLELDRRELTAYHHDPDADPYHSGRDELEAVDVPLAEGSKWQNARLIENFVSWLDGNSSYPTDVESNLQSVALIEAAMESGETGEPVEVQELLQTARERARADLRS